jgi:hypothetical protein
MCYEQYYLSSWLYTLRQEQFWGRRFSFFVTRAEAASDVPRLRLRLFLRRLLFTAPLSPRLSAMKYVKRDTTIPLISDKSDEFVTQIALARQKNGASTFTNW